MRLRAFALAAVFVLMSGGTVAAQTPEGLPIYEPRTAPGVSQVVPAGECTRDTIYDGAQSYGGACERLRVVFGPIWAKPGQNDLLIQPVTFEKPMYDGYLTRFKPNMISLDGTPPVEDIHLHHGTWLNAGRSYGSGPWIASGEEKTIAVWPEGYGLKILASDQWLFLHMVHNATPQTYPVWVTYDLDFVPIATAEADQDPATDGVQPLINNTKGIWLDAGNCGNWYFANGTRTGGSGSGCDSYPFNPIFNVQRGFGEMEHGACVWPNENCAFFNSEGRTSANQGVPPDIDADVLGHDFVVTESFLNGNDVGSLVVMGGHLHSGGIRDDVAIVRDLNGDGIHSEDEERLIHVSDAYYWDYDDPSKVGAPPISWDFSMTGSTLDNGWAVQVKPGDHIRLRGIYDTDIGSWYEQMSIVMTWLAPGDEVGVDLYDEGITPHLGVNRGVPQPEEAYTGALPGSQFGDCDPAVSFCVRGQVTHPHYEASGDHRMCPANGCDPIPLVAPDGALVTDIPIGGFTYGPADMGVVSLSGVPMVKVNSPVTFWNADTANNMWHTVTRCLAPCTGPTSASYPIPDGQYDDLIDLTTGLSADGRTVGQLLTDLGPDPMDFDSSELGAGISVPEDDEIAQYTGLDVPAGPVNTAWTFTPTRTGTFTFYCRIHPSMRGALRVVE
jgi:hypothetical protein